MDLRQLEIVRTVAEKGSFTAAARVLNVSQSAVSRQVLLLEEELGEPVFLRLGRKVRPTGFFIALVTLAYAPVRFLLDFLRETPAYGGDARYLGLTPAQYAALAMFAFGLAVAARVARHPRALPITLGS